MKVVLTKDVKGTGRAHTAVDVKDGHALNFLLPRKLAIPATPSALKHAETRAAKVGEERVMHAKMIEDRLSALAEERIVFTKKANEKGHLYDGVDAKEIAEATKLPVEAIHIEKAFKELGTFDVPVAYGDSFGKLSITIEAE